MSRTTGRPAEVLREGSGIKVGRAADDGLVAQIAYISVYIKDAGISLAKDLPGLLYLQRAVPGRGRLRTSFLAKRELGDARACELLIPMLQNGDISMVIHATIAIGKIGCYDALPSLVQLHNRMVAAPDSSVLKGHSLTVERIIQKLQQGKHESSPD